MCCLKTLFIWFFTILSIPIQGGRVGTPKYECGEEEGAWQGWVGARGSSLHWNSPSMCKGEQEASPW